LEDIAGDDGDNADNFIESPSKRQKTEVNAPASGNAIITSVGNVIANDISCVSHTAIANTTIAANNVNDIDIVNNAATFDSVKLQDNAVMAHPPTRSEISRAIN